MRRAWLIPLVCCLTTTASPVHAQWQATADAGISHLRQNGIPEMNAQVLGASVGILGDRSSLTSNLLATGANGTWTLQGQLVGSLLGPVAQPARWELAGLLSTFGETGEPQASSGEAVVRARFGGSGHGEAVGFGTGAIAHAGRVFGLVHAQGDAWLTTSAGQFVSDLSIVRTRGEAETATSTSFTALSYGDLSLSWHHEAGGLAADVTTGMRAGFGGITGAHGWSSADVAVWLAPRTALVLGVGTTPADFVRSVPSTRYLSAAIRVAGQPHASVNALRPAVRGPQVLVEAAANGVQRLDVRVANATRVELMADFTQWNAETLAHVGGVWRIEQVIQPGLHRVAVRIDGGEWIAPANLSQVTDELGGVVGLITIP